jgi:flagellin-like protein
MFCGDEPQKDSKMKKSWKIRKDLEGVSPVIATILMVAITVVLAAVLYVMVSVIITPPDPGKPVMTFGNFESGSQGTNNYTASWSVAGIDKTDTRFSQYKIALLMDNAPLTTTAQLLLPNTIISFGSTVKVLVRDLGGEGKMSVGDSFLVYGMTAGHGWRLALLWASDSGEVQHQSWSTL